MGAKDVANDEYSVFNSGEFDGGGKAIFSVNQAVCGFNSPGGGRVEVKLRGMVKSLLNSRATSASSISSGRKSYLISELDAGGILTKSSNHILW